jgi:membrane protein
MTWLVYLLFAVAGLLVGGAWSAYQAENRAMTYIAAIGAAVAFTTAVLWMIGEMS